MRKTLEFIGFSFAISVGMSLFILLPGFVRYLFSVGSLYVGFQYFKRNEGWGLRIGMIVTAVILTLLFTVIYVALAYMNGWYINPIYMTGVEKK
ncbi:hypothetical protein [Gorillibacterium timonense]|uniref:hypothetical protein n=1 Tax=Gorillibacterium timonense TaxID=1689269 RepID=UPI00071DF9E6|nr:hypothetical protein [Gorillibacterium timonense]